MNCPQCQTPNQSDSAFCANCGAQLPAEAPASSGYMPPPGQGTPVGYGAPSGYGAPGSPDATGYGAPSYGQSAPAGPTPAGYPQGGGQYQPAPARASSVASFQFDLQRLTRTDLIVGGGTLLVMISIFLTWVTGSVTVAGVTEGAGSLSGTSEHGWLWLVFVLGLLLLAYLVMRAGWAEPPVKLPVAHAPLLLVFTGVQLLLVLIAFFLTPSAPSAADIAAALGASGSASVSWSVGAYLGLIGALVAAAPVAWPAIQSVMANNRR